MGTFGLGTSRREQTWALLWRHARRRCPEPHLLAAQALRCADVADRGNRHDADAWRDMNRLLRGKTAIVSAPAGDVESRRSGVDPVDVIGALNRLDALDRLLLVHVYWDGLRPAQAARLLGWGGRLNAELRLRRALGRLAVSLRHEHETIDLAPGGSPARTPAGRRLARLLRACDPAIGVAVPPVPPSPGTDCRHPRRRVRLRGMWTAACDHAVSRRGLGAVFLAAALVSSVVAVEPGYSTPLPDASKADTVAAAKLSRGRPHTEAGRAGTGEDSGPGRATPMPAQSDVRAGEGIPTAGGTTAEMPRAGDEAARVAALRYEPRWADAPKQGCDPGMFSTAFNGFLDGTGPMYRVESWRVELLELVAPLAVAMLNEIGFYPLQTWEWACDSDTAVAALIPQGRQPCATFYPDITATAPADCVWPIVTFFEQIDGVWGIRTATPLDNCDLVQELTGTWPVSLRPFCREASTGVMVSREARDIFGGDPVWSAIAEWLLLLEPRTQPW